MDLRGLARRCFIACATVALIGFSTLSCGGGGGASGEGSENPGSGNPPSGATSANLIIYAAGSYQVTPESFEDPVKLAYMDSMPFDGVAFASTVGWKLMEASYSPTYTAMASELGHMRGVVTNRLKHNFVVVNANKPCDFFSDWGPTVTKFQNLAKALKWAGVEGIFLDNEVYSPQISLFNWPTDCDTSHTLSEYEDQARLRGKQIMQAMVSEYPDIVVIFAHGPYVSCQETPVGVRAGQSGYSASELMGAFTVGFMEGAGASARIVDGGEFYDYLTSTQFSNSYQWRKSTIATTASDTNLIPTSLRSNWSSRLDISFGLTTIQFPPSTGHVVTPDTLHQSLEYALLRCDSYAWLFPQGTGFDFMSPGGVGSTWLSAVQRAKADATK